MRGYEVHRLARANVDIVILCSIAFDGPRKVVTLGGTFEVPAGRGHRDAIVLDPGQLAGYFVATAYNLLRIARLRA